MNGGELLIKKSVWEMLTEETQNFYPNPNFEEDQPANCIFCGKEMGERQLGFCMPCLIKNDPHFWKKYKKSKEGEKK